MDAINLEGLVLDNSSWYNKLGVGWLYFKRIYSFHHWIWIGLLIIRVSRTLWQLELRMLYFQVVILAATVMLVYYCEFTDTFSPAEQGFNCRDPSLTKPDPGPEQDSRIQPVILYSVVGGLPVVLVSIAVICTIKLIEFPLESWSKYWLSDLNICSSHSQQGNKMNLASK